MINLQHALTIFRREVAAYFNSAIAYIFVIVFVILNSGLFMTSFFLVGRSDMRLFFDTIPYLLAVFLPAISMRQWAEEKQGNTLELLLTFPMGTQSLVLGKFLAGLLFYFVALAATFTIPFMLLFLGMPDLGVILSGYLGTFLLGAFFLALGIFISGLCRDQIVAFIVSMVACFGLHMLGTEFIAASLDGWFPGIGSFLRHFVGAAGHFNSFAKGIIATGDLLYFLIGICIFLVLNGFWFEGRMKPAAKKIFSTATLISIAIFLMSNWLLAGLPLGRFDLSEGRIHTVSDATKDIFRSLKAPVTAKFYVSPQDKMPTGMKSIEQDVIDKLNEFKIHSKGKFRYKIFHMEAANIVEGSAAGKEESLEEQLQYRGIQPFQVQAIDSDELAVRLIYSSIALSYKERAEEIIPRIVPATMGDLEYTIASKVFKMTLRKTPTVAIVAPYQDRAVEPQMAALLKQFGGQIPGNLRDDNYELLERALRYEAYDVRRIKLTENEPISRDVDTLVVIEPEELNERQRYEINRFLVQGGSVFLAVQNYSYDYAPSGRSISIRAIEQRPEINPLLKRWGLEVDENILADEAHEVINVSGGGGGGLMGLFDLSIPVKVPTQILVDQSQMNPELSLTSRLSSLFYLWGTAIKVNERKTDAQDLKVQTLFESSPNSWTVPFVRGGLAGEDFSYRSRIDEGPLPLAVLVEGEFKNVFKGEKIPNWPRPRPELGDEVAPAPLEQEEVELESELGKLILVGAATPFQKQFVRSGGHLVFFMNAIDVLALGEELVRIRSKQPIDRTIGRISAAAKMGWRIFATVLIPVLIALIGTFRVALRRKSKNSYLKELSRRAT